MRGTRVFWLYQAVILLGLLVYANRAWAADAGGGCNAVVTVDSTGHFQAFNCGTDVNCPQPPNTCPANGWQTTGAGWTKWYCACLRAGTQGPPPEPDQCHMYVTKDPLGNYTIAYCTPQAPCQGSARCDFVSIPIYAGTPPVLTGYYWSCACN